MTRQIDRFNERNAAKVRRGEDRVAKRIEIRKAKKLSALSRNDAVTYPQAITRSFFAGYGKDYRGFPSDRQNARIARQWVAGQLDYSASKFKGVSAAQ